MENIGETALPWRVFYRILPESYPFPTPCDPAYELNFGMELLDGDGLRVGYSMRQSRDEAEGPHLKFITLLPEAAPADLVRHHLNHFAIEFRNWIHVAWHDKVILSPHFGGGSEVALKKPALAAADAILAVLSAERPAYLLNEDVLGKARAPMPA